MEQRSRGKSKNEGELSVITNAKNLCSYVLHITDKSPKKFRFTLTIRLQNYSLSIVENLKHGNTWKLRKKILSEAVFTHPSNADLDELFDELMRLRDEKLDKTAAATPTE